MGVLSAFFSIQQARTESAGRVGEEELKELGRLKLLLCNSTNCSNTTRSMLVAYLLLKQNNCKVISN